jgi:hypothetical protein
LLQLEALFCKFLVPLKILHDKLDL